MSVTYSMKAQITGCCFIMYKNGYAAETVPLRLDSKFHKYELRYKRRDAIQAIGGEYYPFLTFGTIRIKLSKPQ